MVASPTLSLIPRVSSFLRVPVGTGGRRATTPDSVRAGAAGGVGTSSTGTSTATVRGSPTGKRRARGPRPPTTTRQAARPTRTESRLSRRDRVPDFLYSLPVPSGPDPGRGSGRDPGGNLSNRHSTKNEKTSFSSSERSRTVNKTRCRSFYEDASISDSQKSHDRRCLRTLSSDTRSFVRAEYGTGGEPGLRKPRTVPLC